MVARFLIFEEKKTKELAHHFNYSQINNDV